MKIRTDLMAALLVGTVGLTTAQSQTHLYWDTNGAAGGFLTPGSFSDGNWDTINAAWNSDATGGAGGAFTAWNDLAAPPDFAHFFVEGGSANPNEADAAITVPGPTPVPPAVSRPTTGMILEDGWLGLTGAGTIGIGTGGLELKANSRLSLDGSGNVAAFTGRIDVGANAITVGNGARLQLVMNTGLAPPIIAAAGHKLILDGGTVNNRHPTALGSNFWVNPGGATQIQLGPNGGTLDTTTGATQFPIFVYTGTFTMTPGTTSATLNKTGRGEMRLSGTNTFTTLNVQQGLLRLNGTGGLDASLGDVNGTVIAHGGTIENEGVGVSLGTSIGVTSPVTRSFQLLATNPLLPDTMFTLNAGWNINGVVSGTGGLALGGFTRDDGLGTPADILGSETQILQLGGNNTYAGSTTINFGVLAATGGNAIPDTSNVVFSTRSNWGGHAGAIPVVRNNAVFRVLANEFVPTITGGNATRGSVEINLGANLSVGTAANFTYSGRVTQTNGVGTLTKVGSGTMTIENFDYGNTGGTNVNEGTLRLGNAAAGLNNTGPVTVAGGATLDMNTVNDTIGSLTGSGTVSRTTGNLIFGQTVAGNRTFSGQITGTGNLTKDGAAWSQTLNQGAGNNSFGTVTVNGGGLILNGANTTTGGTTVNSGGTLGGSGSITGAVAVASGGHIAPGASAGTLTVGSVTLPAGSLLDIEVGGTNFPADFDRLAVTGGATTDGGSVNVSLINGFTPAAGTDYSFHILTAAGGITNTSPLVTSFTLPDHTVSLSQTANFVELIFTASAGLTGDHNGDGTVDAADYVLWRKLNPGENNTHIGYTDWRTHFAETNLGSGGGNGNGAVPEPTSLAMLLLGVAAVAARRRGR